MNKYSQESLIYDKYNIISDNIHTKSNTSVSNVYINKNFQSRKTGSSPNKIKKSISSINSNRSSNSNKIKSNEYSYIDLNEDSSISSPISSILSPNIINYHLKKEKEKEIQSKKKIKHKNHHKKKIPITDDFDTLLNRIEQVVSNDSVNDTKRNLPNVGEHHHHCHSSFRDSTKNKKNKSEEELLLKVKRALILNSSDIKDSDPHQKNTFNNNKSSRRNNSNGRVINNDENNDSNCNQYSKILTDTISEIPSFDEKSNTSAEFKSNEKQKINNHTINKKNHVIDHANNYELNKKEISLKSSPKLNQYLFNKNYDMDQISKPKTEIPANSDYHNISSLNPSYSNEKQNKNDESLNNERIQEFLIYENKKLKEQLMELEQCYEHSLIHHHQNAATTKNSFKGNENDNESELKTKSISCYISYDSLPTPTIIKENNDHRFTSFSDASNRHVYNQKSFTENNNNNYKDYNGIPYNVKVLNNDFNNNYQNSSVKNNNYIRKNGLTNSINDNKNIINITRYNNNDTGNDTINEEKNQSIINSHASINNNYPYNKENLLNMYSSKNENDLDLSYSNCNVLNDYSLNSKSTKDDHNLSSLNSFSMNNIPKIEYNTLIDDTDETMFDVSK